MIVDFNTTTQRVLINNTVDNYRFLGILFLTQEQVKEYMNSEIIIHEGMATIRVDGIKYFHAKCYYDGLYLVFERSDIVNDNLVYDFEDMIYRG